MNRSMPGRNKNALQDGDTVKARTVQAPARVGQSRTLQVTIPAAIARELDLHRGDEMIVTIEDAIHLGYGTGRLVAFRKKVSGRDA